MSEIDYRTTNHNIYYMGKKYAGVNIVTNKLYEDNVTYAQLMAGVDIVVSDPFYCNINDRNHYPDGSDLQANWDYRYTLLVAFMSKLGFSPAAGQTAGTYNVKTDYTFYWNNLNWFYVKVQASANGMYLTFIYVGSDGTERQINGQSAVLYYYKTNIKNGGFIFNIYNAPYEDSITTQLYPYRMGFFWEESNEEWVVMYGNAGNGTRYVYFDAASFGGTLRYFTLNYVQPYPVNKAEACVMSNFYDGTKFYESCYLLIMGNYANTLYPFKFTFNNKQYITVGSCLKTNVSYHPLVFEV